MQLPSLGLLALVLPLLLAAGCKRNTVTLTVSVAASLQGTIDEVESTYTASHPGVEFRNNFGASGTLAREIEQGAPVDVFLSAAAGPMDQLEARGAIDRGSRMNVLQNSLVLIAPADSTLGGFSELADPKVRLIALGDPAGVPAGQYGKAALQSLRLYDKVSAKIVLGKDVRQVLTYVQTGNADAGLVYATDARAEKRVRVVATAPADSHPPIVYPAAALAASTCGAQARAFVKYLAGPESGAIFVRHGFTIASS